MMRSRKYVRTASGPPSLYTRRTSVGRSLTPVIACRYWQKTTARERKEMIRIASRRSANARGIAAAREEMRNSEPIVMEESRNPTTEPEGLRTQDSGLSAADRRANLGRA